MANSVPLRLLACRIFPGHLETTGAELPLTNDDRLLLQCNAAECRGFTWVPGWRYVERMAPPHLISIFATL
jgi:hypothetical protein